LLLLACTDGDDPQTETEPEDCVVVGDEDNDGAADCWDEDCLDWCGELCGNGQDDDGDQLVDCADPDCARECTETDCWDGKDNDGDGGADCADSDCDHLSQCEEDCSNGEDDDGDGLLDCEDGSCVDYPGCLEDCADGTDNDEDGLVDCDDDDCWGLLVCLPEGSEVRSRVQTAHAFRLAERYRGYVVGGWSTKQSFDGRGIQGTAVVATARASWFCTWGVGAVHGEPYDSAERWGFSVDPDCPVQTSGFLPRSPWPSGTRVLTGSPWRDSEGPVATWYGGQIRSTVYRSKGWTHSYSGFSVQTTSLFRYLSV
jgi:hypothetical protein